MTTSPTCIIAYTSEEGHFPEVREAAFRTARAANARLILYDIDAASPWAKPLPTAVSADGAEDQIPPELTIDDLERAGRPAIARQVLDARGQGIDAYAWLPGEAGGDALADYAHQEGADLIMLPASMKDPGFFDRLRGKSLDKVQDHVKRPIELVHPDGTIEAIQDDD